MPHGAGAAERARKWLKWPKWLRGRRGPCHALAGFAATPARGKGLIRFGKIYQSDGQILCGGPTPSAGRQLCARSPSGRVQRHCSPCQRSERWPCPLKTRASCRCSDADLRCVCTTFFSDVHHKHTFVTLFRQPACTHTPNTFRNHPPTRLPCVHGAVLYRVLCRRPAIPGCGGYRLTIFAG